MKKDDSSIWNAYNDGGFSQKKPPQNTDRDIFSQYWALSSGLPNAAPIDLVPRRHQEPTWNDETIIFPDLKKVFAADLKLSNVKEGLHSQKVNQNITEMANAISLRYKLASLSGQLAVYSPPCWNLMRTDEAINFIFKAIGHLFPGDIGFLNSRQFRDIEFQLLHHPNTVQLNNIPTPDYHYLCCVDALYDWTSGKIMPHDSRCWRFYALSLEADKIGKSSGEYWEMFLENLTDGNEAIRQRILEMIGVIITGYPSKSFFLLQGESGTGKSQLANFIRDVLGESACFALNDISQLGEKWTPGSLFGKLLCLCGDVPNIALSSKAIGNIKQLTGDDLIRGELKYKNAFTFENIAKLLFVSNYPLTIPNAQQEQALLDRLVVIPCLNPVPKEQQISKLHQHLHEEAGYIIGLALDALEDFDSRNGVFTPLPSTIETGGFQIPDAEQRICDFVRNCCQLDESGTCSVKDVYAAFERYDSNQQRNAIPVMQFSKVLLRICHPQIKTHRTGKTRSYQGIRLNR